MSTATRKPAEDRSLLEAAARAWSGPEPELHETSLTDCIEQAITEHRKLGLRLEAIQKAILSATIKTTEN